MSQLWLLFDSIFKESSISVIIRSYVHFIDIYEYIYEGEEWVSMTTKI